MAVERLDSPTPGATPPGTSSRSSDAIGPAQGDARIEAPFGVGAVAPSGVRRSPPEIDEAIDPIEEVRALSDGRAITGPAGGLAAQLLDYVTPRPPNADALTQPRIVPLLGLAADQVGSVTGRADLLDTLGIKALQQELENHRELAERRSNRIEP